MGNSFKILKRIFCLLIILGQLVVLSGCPSNLDTNDNNNNNGEQQQIKVWNSYNYTLFNTVSVILSYKGDTQEEFKTNSDLAYEILGEYHQLFDIYYEYSGVTNLCTINKNAGGEPLVVDQKLIDFLLYAKEIYTITNGETNVMLGSVLKIWHDAREKKNYVPSIEALQSANLHTSIDFLEIDDVNNTVRISDPLASIDVGALGKGYATEKVAEFLEEKGCTSYVLNIGGNLRTIGSKKDGSGWGTGITNPKGYPKYALEIIINNTSCVTSGDYERYYTFEGKKYHHIIDKDTLMPADYFSSVTILVNDSGLADALSTALFSMPYEQGKELAKSLAVDVIWIDKEGKVTYTDGVVLK